MQLGGTAFFSSTQMQANDRTRTWVILSLFILLIAWLVWFFAIPLPQTITSETAVFDTTNTLTATFTSEALVQLEPMQTAELTLTDFPRETYGTVPLQLNRIDPTLRDGRITADFQLDHNNAPDLPYQRHLDGTVHITIGRKTAAQLVWETLQTLQQ